ncbi:MAG: 5-methyltetrahydropteroyltriglutamate--homocysteine S-methyltransferase [Thermomicrobiales bacterium]|jgi:5-methyltetrahydropteroyltriglutamate--homocysteine methyltransferase|nr:5-methyltetrahydropteroyltriglutamate--homocysteine S-methyltransferase [Thermomicrobiales bacterium]
MAQSTIAGYPRIGRERQLKWTTEKYWTGKIDADALLDTARAIRHENWANQIQAGIDLIPVNDFSHYDQMLDMAALLGAGLEGYAEPGAMVDIDAYFRMARGSDAGGPPPLDMTKWFDTNYHYLAPVIDASQPFRIASEKPFAELAEAVAAGYRAKVVLIGPITFLRLSRTRQDVDPLELLGALLPVYAEVISRLAAGGAEWIELQEPSLVAGHGAGLEPHITRAYTSLADAAGSTKLLIHLPFGDPGELLDALVGLPVDGLGFDLTRSDDLAQRIVASGWPEDKFLAAGIVDGRNIWINDLDASLATLWHLAMATGSDRLIVTSSCSLLHVPHDVRVESDLDPDLASWLAFADQKLVEIAALTSAIDAGDDAALTSDAYRRARASMSSSERRRNPAVRERIQGISDDQRRRRSPYPTRRSVQEAELSLPLLPTTTIGSFPQTSDLRKARRQLDAGELEQTAYDEIIAASITATITEQETLGLDVLVHGEPERNDMVQYFAEQMEGFAFTHDGWVQSYGTRCVRPPIIFGDVSRPAAMSVRWSRYAQSLTDKPVKGMLTGPVTMLNWSFVRDDQSRAETCEQIALAIRDEVDDLAAAGLRIIQIDEPALREGLPLDRAQWSDYLAWATACFRLASSSAPDQVQIHTHMCYSDFGDVIEAIDALDADVLSIENTRSSDEMLAVFGDYGYTKGVGPGVYDVHSPRVPSVDELTDSIRSLVTWLDKQQVWINPDCGLKTRRPDEVYPSLSNMVQATRQVREELRGP